ncbi:MAG: glycosyl hydrolase family 18 protein [Lachnospiraceae bacterium]
MDERDRVDSDRPRASRANSSRPSTNRPVPDQRRRRQSSERKRRQKRNRILIVFIILLLALAAIGAVLVWSRYGPSKEKADLNGYYGIQNQDQLAVVMDNKVVGAGGMIIEGRPYIEYGVVRDNINSRFYWDVNENVLLYTLPNEIISVGVGSNEYTAAQGKSSEDYVILKTEGSTAYIALDFIQKYTNIDYKTYKSPQRVVIDGDWGEKKVASVKSDTQVRYRAGVKSPILTEVKKKTDVTVLEKEGSWKKVRTSDGFVGYTKESALKSVRTEKTSREFDESINQFTNISKPYTINMAWHQVTSQTANASVLETIASTKGLTTISPTWFSVADNDGNISSIASPEYVNYAHQSNIEVWALVDNFNENVDSLAVLSHTSKRENMENQLIANALQTGVDGINVDFERIAEDAGEHYIQFIRELSVKCRQNSLVLSVDNYVPKGYSAHYHREEQGKVADYVIIMGYDEHFGGSPESGSVASYNFVKEGIEETVKQVPAEKVINAVPFYTRLWKEVSKEVTSEALGMAEAEARVAAAGVQPTWDDKTQQNYAQWDADGGTYKIWLEDALSIEAKLKLMKENKLAGTAAWKLGFEKPEIWDVILKYVN